MIARPDKILVQVRLPRDLVREIDHLAIDRGVYRAQMMALVLEAGIRELRKPFALRVEVAE